MSVQLTSPLGSSKQRRHIRYDNSAAVSETALAAQSDSVHGLLQILLAGGGIDSRRVEVLVAK